MYEMSETNISDAELHRLLCEEWGAEPSGDDVAEYRSWYLGSCGVR